MAGMVAPRLPRSRPSTRSCLVVARAFLGALAVVVLDRVVGLERDRLLALAFFTGTSEVDDIIVAPPRPHRGLATRGVRASAPLVGALSPNSNAPFAAVVQRNVSNLVARTVQIRRFRCCGSIPLAPATQSGVRPSSYESARTGRKQRRFVHLDRSPHSRFAELGPRIAESLRPRPRKLPFREAEIGDFRLIGHCVPIEQSPTRLIAF